MKSIQLSENRFNQLVAEVSRKLMDAYSFPGGSIRGEDIVHFSSHKQVNNFVLFLIYQDWNNQFGKFINPNFDFENQEVREGLKKFLNVLSRHIKVRKEDFGKMVEKAVYNSLKLALNPEDAFRSFFYQGTDKISVEAFQRYAGYFSDYDFAIQGILKYLHKNQVKIFERDVFLEKFRRVCQLFDEMEGKSMAAYQKFLFNRLTGLDMDQVAATDKTTVENAVPPVQPPPVVKTPPPSNLGSTFIKREPLPPPSIEKKVESKFPPPAVFEKKIETVNPPPVIQPPQKVVQPVAEKKIESPLPPVVNTPRFPPPVPPVIENKEANTLNESLGKKPTLSDTFVREQQEKMKAMLEKIQHPKVETPQTPPVVVETPREELKPVPPVEETPVEVKKEVVIQPELPATPLNFENPIQENKETGTEPISEGQPIDLFGSSLVQNALPETEINLDDNQKIAEKFKATNGVSSLHEKLATNNIKLEQIPVNKQFQFVQKIFGGSSVKFKVILDKVNQTNSQAEAKEVLEKYVFNSPEVSKTDKISEEFVTLVMNRFH